ncbi:hypothetical protein AMTRI_Chr03g53820 [Amborella trichopoda]|nr:protein MALE DISCOVERER 2 [Amborella trichopoda]|eukprot:XP_020520086.1 protein MALE DISCOVERER 2 [Amborella trichopoda]
MDSWMLGLIGAASLLALILLIFLTLHLILVTRLFNGRKVSLFDKQFQAHPNDGRLPVYSFKKIHKFSEGFSNKVGVGSTHLVFKGILPDGTEIAIKKPILEAPHNSDVDAWSKSQLELLSCIWHQHLVNLIGSCKNAGYRILVFQYASNGTLHEHLHGHEHLTWKQRMKIIAGVAYGLSFLHHSCDPPISHGNLTSRNILLTEDYAAKIGGLGKMPVLGSSEFVMARKPGASEKRLCRRADDVYSFGILVLEIVSGRLAFSEKTGFLVKWAMDILVSQERSMELLDEAVGDVVKEEVYVIAEVVRMCLLREAVRRPFMREVAEMLRNGLGITMEMAAPVSSPVSLRGLFDIL